MKCLSKDVNERYAGIGELADELRGYLARNKRANEGTHPPSIAVLPFSDATQERNQDHFCDGMAEELNSRLARVRDLRVVSRSLVQQYRDVRDVQKLGRQLGVDAVLVGAVRETGTQLRITAELVNVADGCQLWSDRFNRAMEDVFAIQEEIACAIAQSLKLKLSAGERRFLQAPPTQDVQAYEYYLRGRKFFYQYRRKGTTLAIQMFRLAIKHDPDYALAYAGIADSYCFLMLHSRFDDEILKWADDASLRALELAPDSSEAHTSRANVLSTCDRHEEAEAEFEAAVKLGPGLFDAYYLYAREAFAQGKLEKAIELYRLRIRVEPARLSGAAPGGAELRKARATRRSGRLPPPRSRNRRGTSCLLA